VPVRLEDRIDGNPNVLGQALIDETRYADGSRLVGTSIRLQRGLPAVQLASVVAHEIAHVWLWSSAPTPQKLDDEGVAELCGYWVLGHLGGEAAAALQRRIASNTDALYGAGFRRARQAEDLHGWPSVRSHLLTYGRLP
jgi:hypothetical protein